MRVSKIPVPAGSGYPFLISISYPLWVLFADTHGTYIFDIPNRDDLSHNFISYLSLEASSFEIIHPTYVALLGKEASSSNMIPSLSLGWSLL